MRLVVQGRNLKFRDGGGKESDRIRFYATDFKDILPVGTKMWVPKFDKQATGDGNHVMVHLVGYEVNFASDFTGHVTEAILEVDYQGATDRVITIKAPWELRNSCLD